VPGDLPPLCQTTAISWEIDVPTVADMAARIDGLRATHEWLVLERDDQIIGFAYGQR
jgi:L-amino acid N-acyltransferase YncA